MPNISVVIPSKDRLPYLRRAVDRFLAQEEVAEVVVIADGCTDETVPYLEEAAAVESRIRYAVNEVNRGIAYSRKRGIDLSRYEYIYTGEDDLEFSPDLFKTLLAHMAETGADVISARNVFRFERESEEAALARTAQLSGPSINKRLIIVHVGMDTNVDSVQPMLPSPMLGRAEVFLKVPFDPRYKGMAWREETDFQLSAVAAGYKLVFCPHAVTFNLMIEKDRGGARADTGMTRALKIIGLNLYFLNKHRDYLARQFGVQHPRLHMIRFSAWIIFRLVALPALHRAKLRVFGPRPWVWVQRFAR